MHNKVGVARFVAVATTLTMNIIIKMLANKCKKL